MLIGSAVSLSNALLLFSLPSCVLLYIHLNLILIILKMCLDSLEREKKPTSHYMNEDL